MGKDKRKYKILHTRRCAREHRTKTTDRQLDVAGYKLDKPTQFRKQYHSSDIQSPSSPILSYVVQDLEPGKYGISRPDAADNLQELESRDMYLDQKARFLSSHCTPDPHIAVMEADLDEDGDPALMETNHKNSRSRKTVIRSNQPVHETVDMMRSDSLMGSPVQGTNCQPYGMTTDVCSYILLPAEDANRHSRAQEQHTVTHFSNSNGGIKNYMKESKPIRRTYYPNRDTNYDAQSDQILDVVCDNHEDSETETEDFPYPFSYLIGVLTVLSSLLLVVDIFTDALLAEEYFIHGRYWEFAATTFFIVFPAIFTTALSVIFFCQEEEKCMHFCECGWILTFVFSVLPIAPILR